MKIPYLIILLAVSLLGSCNIMDDEVCSGQSSPITAPVQVGFTLTTGDVSSRAITEGEGNATERENYIDIPGRDFRFLLFDEENKYLTTFQVDDITPLSGTKGKKYYVTGELSEPYSSFKLVVLANWGKAYPMDLIPEETTIEQVCSATTAIYTYDGNFNINTDLIPMYGVRTYNDIEWRANLLTELPNEVDLLRAMAKIEVNCNAEGFKLNGVTLHRYNTTGYCAPSNVYSDTQDNWGYDNNMVCNHTIHIPTNVSEETELAFTPNPQEENSYIVYVPEFDNTIENGERNNYIEVKLQRADGTEVTLTDKPYIYFCEYNNEGTPVDNTDFDIVRNHWYSYDITQVDDGKLIFQYRVRRWNVVESSIGWNAEPLLIAWGGEEDNATEGDNEAKYCYVCNPGYDEEYEDSEGKNDHTVLKDGTSGAAFSFTLTVPEGAVWEAQLSNKEDFYFSYDTYDNGTKHCVSTGIARKEEYQIKIHARYPWTEYTAGSTPDFDAEETEKGREFASYQGKGGVYTDLSIRVSLDGENYYDLVINPEGAVNENNTYFKDGRRFAGNDTHVRIWQLKAEKGANYTALFEASEDIEPYRKYE